MKVYEEKERRKKKHFMIEASDRLSLSTSFSTRKGSRFRGQVSPPSITRPSATTIVVDSSAATEHPALFLLDHCPGFHVVAVHKLSCQTSCIIDKKDRRTYKKYLTLFALLSLLLLRQTVQALLLFQFAYYI